MSEKFSLPRAGVFQAPYSNPHVVKTDDACELYVNNTLTQEGACAGSPGNFVMITETGIIKCDQKSCELIDL